MATANAVDSEATNVTSAHAASAEGGQHFIRLGAVLDVHFPGVYESHYWHAPLPVVGWYAATVVDGPDFRGAGMGLQLAAFVPFLNVLALLPVATVTATSTYLHMDKGRRQARSV